MKEKSDYINSQCFGMLLIVSLKKSNLPLMAATVLHEVLTILLKKTLYMVNFSEVYFIAINMTFW